MVQTRIFRALLFLSLVALAIPLFAQQTGAIHGRVQATDGSVLPGVTVEARSNVLPQPRVTSRSARALARSARSSSQEVMPSAQLTSSM